MTNNEIEQLKKENKLLHEQINTLINQINELTKQNKELLQKINLLMEKQREIPQKEISHPRYKKLPQHAEYLISNGYRAGLPENDTYKIVKRFHNVSIEDVKRFYNKLDRDVEKKHDREYAKKGKKNRAKNEHTSIDRLNELTVKGMIYREEMNKKIRENPDKYKNIIYPYEEFENSDDFEEEYDRIFGKDDDYSDDYNED